MGYIEVDMMNVGGTPTPSIERVGDAPTADLYLVGDNLITTIHKVGKPIIPSLTHLGGVVVKGAVTPTIGRDSLVISETALSFDNSEVGTSKVVYVNASRMWSAQLIDPDGLFSISTIGGLGGATREVVITLVNANEQTNIYTASVVFKCGGMRKILQLTSKAGALGYTPLTYIECNGQQYINTGYVVQEDDVIEMYYISKSNTSEDKALFGAYDDSGKILASIYSNAGYFRFGNEVSTSISNARRRYKLTLQKGSVDIDGSEGSPDFSSMPKSPLYLFACNNNNSEVSMYGVLQTFGFRISKASKEVVMDLKPCKRNYDGAIGMLDAVSGTFYVNQSDGEDFAYGSEIRIGSGYEVLDYVTFNADKLYDAGIINNTQTIEVLFNRTETSKTPYLYGVITSPHTATVSAYMGSGGAWRFGAYYKGTNTNTTKIYKVEISDGKATFDYSAGSFTKSTFTTPATLVVGGSRNASGSTSESFIGYVYYFRIKEGAELILDWQPCKRLSDGVEGFWDCVSQTFIEPM